MKEVVPPYPSDVKEAPLTQLEKPLQIAVNTPVTISGLTSKTRYEAVVKVDKKSLVKLEADGKVVAEGELDGLPIYFAPTTTSAGVVTGLQKMLGTAVITTPMLTTSTVIATFKKATGITNWSGKAVISYLGPIS
jgi:hypothetical protein